VLLKCESCEFATNVGKEAMRHAGNTRHALVGETAEGNTITVYVADDDLEDEQ
jgi:hypothetical protein